MNGEAGGGLYYPDSAEEAAPDPSAILAGIRERAEGPMRKFRDVDASQRDVRHLLAAVEAVLKAAQRLDKGWGDYGHLVNRHETADMFREAITSALTGERTRHDPECRDPSCKICRDVTGPLVDYEVLGEDGEHG